VSTPLTNTKNTLIEALERHYPMRVLRYRLRQGSGGAGLYPGGEGIGRDLLMLEGSAGGESGAAGENWLLPGDVSRYYHTVMAKEKVTLTLDTDQLEELRSLVDARSLSATVDVAVGSHLSRLRHLRAVDAWLAELEAQHGPVEPETLEWAARIVDDWESGRHHTSRAG
jgi:hypothetical protein